MVFESVMAAIDRGDNGRNYLALHPSQRTRPMHQLDIEIVVQPHDATVNAMDPHDVVIICNSIGMLSHSVFEASSSIGTCPSIIAILPGDASSGQVRADRSCPG